MQEQRTEEAAGRVDRYDPQAVEVRWQAEWQRTRLYETDLRAAGRPFYNLMMFPYPSAEGLHVGNMYAFTGADIYGRFVAMRGQDVFEPIGFDAFGIHSENFAIQRGVHPRVLTAQNVEGFRAQLRRIGNRFDWSHEVLTTEPDYYRWTQWIFVQLFKAGLAVRKRAPVNWCPRDKTVLADEQVIDGLCERCSTPVEKRELEQWFLRITAYAERLLTNLEQLDWSDVVRSAQRNWIGRSEGAEFTLPIEGRDDLPGLRVFTTRPDTAFGMTFAVLAPEHPLVPEITAPERRTEAEAFVERVRRESEVERVSAEGTSERRGVFTGAYAVNPFNGAPVPIYLADYVLMGYGTGAIMAVPGQDQRDWDFAVAHDLPIVRTVQPPDGWQGEAYTGEGPTINSGWLDGSADIATARARAIAWLEEQGAGERTVRYRLRDWLISRQRYWGPPIPIVYCDTCGTVPVPEDQLPVLLPELTDWLPTGTGTSPLARLPEFVNTTCPTCGGPARRETDVSDNFLDSAWYFLRYPSTEYDDRPFDAERTSKWLPVDMYIGGPEHSVLHLLYCRFIGMALHDLGFLPFEEPIARFRAHGHLTRDGAKMGKSKGNVVNPDAYVERYGADTLRLYLVFIGPFDQGGDFTDRAIGGIVRFLTRVWDLVLRHAGRIAQDAPAIEARRSLHQTIQRVSDDIGALKYNTAIAALMEYLNDLQRRPTIHAEEVESLLILLAPFAPHVTEELWARLGRPYSIHQQRFPEADPALVASSTVEVAVQVNGRTRGTVELPPAATEDDALTAARALPAVQSQLATGSIRRVIYVPGRVINVVV